MDKKPLVALTFDHAGVDLRELRQERGLSQSALARRMGVSQPQITHNETRSDLLLSTLRRHIEGLGGQLILVARFPEKNLWLNGFQGREPPG